MTARRTVAQKEQLRLLFEAGAVAPAKGVEARNTPGLNPLTVGPLRKHKLVDSKGIKTAQRAYTIYWLTPLGVAAAEAERRVVPKKRAAKKPAKAKRGEAFDARDWIVEQSKVTAPGLYRMPAEAYHRDPCPAPAMSSGLAELLVQRSPRHAYHRAPKGGDQALTPTYAMDIGSAVHAVTFRFSELVASIDKPNFQDGQAKNWRAAIRQDGRIPILKRDVERVLAMADIARAEIEAFMECAIEECVREIVIAWRERAWARGMIDVMRCDGRRILDVKTTEMSAHPDDAGARLFAHGAHLQEALYTRGLDRIDPKGQGRRRYAFLAIEQDPPHGHCLLEIDEASRDVARAQIEYAMGVWADCVESGVWPGYAKGVQPASMPTWAQMQWTRRQIEMAQHIPMNEAR